MNLELLIKLVKLANNNPNEHEANAAARRACKLIAEGKFNFVADIEPVKTAQAKVKVTSTPKTPDYKTYTQPRYQSFTDLWETLEKMLEEQRKKDEAYFKAYGGFKATRDPRNPYDIPRPSQKDPRTYHPDDEKYYSRRKERGFGDSKRRLKCKTCNQTKETIFMGLEAIFECNECIWNKAFK